MCVGFRQDMRCMTGGRGVLGKRMCVLKWTKITFVFVFCVG
jgi:hypothetical protein